MAVFFMVWCPDLAMAAPVTVPTCIHLFQNTNTQSKPFFKRVITWIAPDLEPSRRQVLTTQLDASWQELSNISEVILRQFPPGKNIYLGIGRSPTPLLALFKEMGVQALNLPLSHMRNHPLPRGSTTEVSLSKRILRALQLILPERLEPLTSDEESRLFEHFDKFLPPASELSNKTLVLIDYVQTGDSMIAASEYILRYYMETYAASIQIEMVGLASPTHTRSAGMDTATIINMDPKGALLDAFESQAFDRYGQFGQFQVSGVRNRNDLNPLYAFLVNKIREKLIEHKN